MLFNHWKNYADSENISRFTQLQAKVCLLSSFLDLSKCHGDTKKANIVKKFLNNNPNILICPVDKSKNLIILYKIDYEAKLETVFQDGKNLLN